MIRRSVATFLLLHSCAFAAQPAPTVVEPGARETGPGPLVAVEDSSPRERVRRVDYQFGTELPRTLGRHRLEFSLRPRWEDLVDEEYLRVSLELHRGFGDRLEAWVGVVPFLESPFQSGEDSRSGPGELFLGTKRSLLGGDGRDELTVGLRLEFPLGRPPAGVSDGWTHVRPFVVWAHLHGREVGLLSYVNVSADVAERPPGKSRPEDEPPRHRILVRPGFLLQLEAWRWSFEVEMSSDRIDGGDRNEIFLKPGATWTPPRGFGRAAYLKDRLEVGAYLRFGVHDTEDDLSLGSHIRVRFDRKRLRSSLRGEPPSAD